MNKDPQTHKKQEEFNDEIGVINSVDLGLVPIVTKEEDIVLNRVKNVDKDMVKSPNKRKRSPSKDRNLSGRALASPFHNKEGIQSVRKQDLGANKKELGKVIGFYQKIQERKDQTGPLDTALKPRVPDQAEALLVTDLRKSSDRDLKGSLEIRITGKYEKTEKTKKKYLRGSKKGPVHFENSKYHDIRNMFENIGGNAVAEKVFKEKEEKGEVAKKVVLLDNNCKQGTTGSSHQNVKRLEKSFIEKKKMFIFKGGK